MYEDFSVDGHLESAYEDRFYVADDPVGDEECSGRRCGVCGHFDSWSCEDWPGECAARAVWLGRAPAEQLVIARFRIDSHRVLALSWFDATWADPAEWVVSLLVASPASVRYGGSPEIDCSAGGRFLDRGGAIAEFVRLLRLEVAPAA